MFDIPLLPLGRFQSISLIIRKLLLIMIVLSAPTFRMNDNVDARTGVGMVVNIFCSREGRVL